MKIVKLGLLLLLLILPLTVMAQRYGEILCQEEGYTCFKVPKGESWESLFPDNHQRDVIKRINRMNIPLRTGMIISVPENLENLNSMKFSPFDFRVEPTGKKTIIVDPTLLAYGAYDQYGNLMKWGPVAVGKNWCPDTQSSCRTKVGVFNIYQKRGEGCISSKFPIPEGGAPMPYCMFFSGGYAIHGGETPGHQASHGCVRVFYEDALWLSQEFAEIGTTVIIKPYEA